MSYVLTVTTYKKGELKKPSIDIDHYLEEDRWDYINECNKWEGGGDVLGRQANLEESSKSKELAEMRLQVLVVVITSDACESKKEIMRLRE